MTRQEAIAEALANLTAEGAAKFEAQAVEMLCERTGCDPVTASAVLRELGLLMAAELELVAPLSH